MLKRHETYGSLESFKSSVKRMDVPVNRRSKVFVGVGALVTAAGLALTFGLTSANAADPTPVSITQLQQAHDQIASANATIQSYIDQQNSTPPAGDQQAPQGVTATPGDGTITIHWSAPTAATGLTGYVYGRDGVDTGGFGAYDSSLQPTTTASAVLDKLVNGTSYNVYVAAVYSDGSTTAHRVTLASTPSAGTPPTTVPPTTVPPTTVPPTTTPPPLNSHLSGLPWSSGVWAEQDRSMTSSFESGPRGGTVDDNYLVYASRGSVASENNPSEWRSGLPANFNGVTQDLVLGLTTWTSDGAFMTGAQGAQIGTSLCSVDGTHPIVRLDWEMNLPDGAGSNGAELTSSNSSAWDARFNAVASGIKSTCPSALIDFNPNAGADQTPGCSGTTCTRNAFQAVKNNVDIYGIDSYDWFPGGAAHTSGTNNLQDAYNYAQANGKKFSVPEWGVSCNSGSSCSAGSNGGGDDANYIHGMLGFFKTNAAGMAYETYFNEPASYIVSDLVSHNPNARAQYKADILASVIH